MLSLLSDSTKILNVAQIDTVSHPNITKVLTYLFNNDVSLVEAHVGWVTDLFSYAF